MTRIKICGITNPADLEAAVGAGADAVGVIGVRESPRYVASGQAIELLQGLPPYVQKVVVVNRPADAGGYGADVIQYYEADTAEMDPRIRLVRCFRMRDASSLDDIRDCREPYSAVHLDTYHKNKLGGSGESFNWDLALNAKDIVGKPIVLAGGLTPDNVQKALHVVRPYAVDVSSGVEIKPGIKDHSLVQAFIRSVREWDLSQKPPTSRG